MSTYYISACVCFYVCSYIWCVNSNVNAFKMRGKEKRLGKCIFYFRKSFLKTLVLKCFYWESWYAFHHSQHHSYACPFRKEVHIKCNSYINRDMIFKKKYFSIYIKSPYSSYFFLNIKLYLQNLVETFSDKMLEWD